MDNYSNNGWYGIWNDGYGGTVDYKDMLVKSVQLAKKNAKPIQSCPYTKPKKKQELQCKFETLKISKDGREFDLILNGSEKKDTEKLYEIVAGCKDKLSTVKCSIQGLINTKGDHKNKIFMFNKKVVSKSDTKLEFLAAAKNTKWQFPWECAAEIYTVTANSCGKSITAKIAAYQDLEIELKANINFGEKSSTTVLESEIKRKSKNTIGTKETPTEETESGLSVSGSIKFDGKTFESKIEFKNTLERIKTIVKTAKSVKKHLKTIKEAADAISISNNIHNKSKDKLTVKYPNIEFGIKCNWEEIEGCYQVDFVHESTIKADPLVGVEFDCDIIGFLLKASPFGIAKNLIEKYLAADVFSLRLKVGGEFAGEYSKKIYRKNKTDISGKLSGKIPYELKATLIKIEEEVIIFCFTYKISVELSAAVKSFLYLETEISQAGTKIELGNDELEVSITAEFSADIGTKKIGKPPPGASSQSRGQSVGSAPSAEYSLWKTEKVILYDSGYL
jgi:hypothetical protein